MQHCFIIAATLSQNPVSHHFMALAKELAGRGHKVIFISPHRRVELEDHDSNPAIYTWPSERPTTMIDALFLRRLLKQHQPSCLTANFVAVNIMNLVGALHKVPARVAWYHTVTGQIVHDFGQSSWKAKFLQFRKRIVYRAATNIVANSQASADDVQQIYGVPEQKCRVFHNSLEDPLRNFELTSVPTESGRLVCVGRLYPSKGQDILLRAIAILKSSIPSIHVEFVGEGPEQASYEQLACQLGVRDKCTFTGQVSHSDVLKKMASAVVTVVPSRSEAFGLVNIESMAVGTPVVASKVGGIVEIIRHGVDGFLVPPDDASALAEKVKILLCNPHVRREMRTNCRQRFLEKFEQRRSIVEQADWHEELLNSK